MLTIQFDHICATDKPDKDIMKTSNSKTSNAESST